MLYSANAAAAFEICNCSIFTYFNSQMRLVCWKLYSHEVPTVIQQLAQTGMKAVTFLPTH